MIISTNMIPLKNIMQDLLMLATKMLFTSVSYKGRFYSKLGPLKTKKAGFYV